MNSSSLVIHTLILVIVSASSASAQDITELEQRIDKLERANTQLQQTVKRLSREVELLRKTTALEKPVKNKSIEGKAYSKLTRDGKARTQSKTDKGESSDVAKAESDKSDLYDEFLKGGKVILTLRLEKKSKLLPGDKVAVYKSGTITKTKDESDAPKHKTKPIVSSAIIYEYGTSRTSDAPDAEVINTVSLMLDSEHAGQVFMATKKGTMFVELRKNE